MRFTAGTLPGVFVVDIERLGDERGFFARTWCAREFREHGLPDTLSQASISYNRIAGTLRGMHYQRPPGREGKLVRCIHGAVFDVVVDLRPGSPGFLHHETVELSAANRRAIYVPPGFAHGFQALAADTEVQYQMTADYDAGLSGGFRWNDPAAGINWPLPPTVMSDRDRHYPDIAASDFDAFRNF